MKKVIKSIVFVGALSGIGCFYCNAGTTKEEVENKPTQIQLDKTKQGDTQIKSDSIASLITQTQGNPQQNILRKIFQSDALPTSKSVTQNNASNGKKSVAIIPGQDRSTIAIYPDGKCVVTDTRIVPVKQGSNNVRLLDLIAGDPISVTFRTPKKGSIILNKYCFNIIDDIEFYNKNNAEPRGFNAVRNKILDRAVGHDVWVRKNENPKELRKMKLIKSGNSSGMSFCENDNHYEFVEYYELQGISKDVIDVCQNFINATFNSDVADDVEIEISYLSPFITCEYAYDIDIFDKLDRIDVASKYIIKNNSSNDVKNTNVIIKQNDLKFSDVDIDSKSSTACVKHEKNTAHSIRYGINLSKYDLDKCSTDTKEKTNLTVCNLITFSKKQRKTFGFNESSDAHIIVYRRHGEDRNLYKQFKLSEMIKNGDDWNIEVGEADGVTAKCQVIDRNNNLKDQIDYSIRITLQNDRMEDVELCVNIDEDQNKYSVLKSNIGESNNTWNIQLKPSETKELQIKLRIKK